MRPGTETDGADALVVLERTWECASAWDPNVRLLGNVRAGDLARAIREALDIAKRVKQIEAEMTMKRLTTDDTPDLASIPEPEDEDAALDAGGVQIGDEESYTPGPRPDVVVYDPSTSEFTVSEACGKWVDLGDGDGYECDGEKGHPGACDEYPDMISDGKV